MIGALNVSFKIAYDILFKGHIHCHITFAIIESLVDLYIFFGSPFAIAVACIAFGYSSNKWNRIHLIKQPI